VERKKSVNDRDGERRVQGSDEEVMGEVEKQNENGVQKLANVSGTTITNTTGKFHEPKHKVLMISRVIMLIDEHMHVQINTVCWLRRDTPQCSGTV